jgi:hypothetical protein
MLAYWHYANKGSLPFKKALTPEGLEEVKTDAHLTDEQSEFIGRTAHVIQGKGAHSF